MNKEKSTDTIRRKAIRQTLAGGAVVGAVGALTQSPAWIKPVVQSAVLPVHAQSSGGGGTISCSANEAYGPGAYSFTVPAGVTVLDVVAEGAGGGNGGNGAGGGLIGLGANGGLGAMASGTITVSPGQVLQIVVGSKGGDGSDGGRDPNWDGAASCTPLCTAGPGGPHNGGPLNGAAGATTGGLGGDGEGGGRNGGGGGGGGGGTFLKINGISCIVAGGGGGGGAGASAESGGEGADTGEATGIEGETAVIGGGTGGTSGDGGGGGGTSFLNSGQPTASSGESGGIGGNGYTLLNGYMVGDPYPHPGNTNVWTSGGGGGGGGGGGAVGGGGGGAGGSFNNGLQPSGGGGGGAGSSLIDAGKVTGGAIQDATVSGDGSLTLTCA